MLRIVLMVGTRKGCFLLESDEARQTGRSAARSARAGRSTTPSTTPSSGTVFAAAASEWHGAGDLALGATSARRWEHSSDGLAYGDAVS